MSLDILKIENLRDVVNIPSVQNNLMNSVNWDKFCVAMDLINVAVAYINRIHWDEQMPPFAFQLFELITAGQMIKNGLYEIINILRVNNSLKTDTSIFNIGGKCDDKIFSEYRALTFAHVLDFDSNNHFANNSESYFAWCYWLDYNDKIAITNQYLPDKETCQILIDYKKVYKYIEKRYNYLDVVVKSLKRKYKKQVE